MAQHILKPGDLAQSFDFTDVGGTFTVTSGSTVYYGSTQAVTSTAFDGSVAVSATSPTLYGVQWLVVDRSASSPSRIEKTRGSLASAVENEQRLSLVESSVAPVLNVSKAPYNVLPGSSNPQVGIQAAIDQANANAVAGSGATRVFVPAGTYTCDLQSIGGSSLYFACLYGRSNVTLEFAPGAVIKLKNSATLPGGANQASIISVLSPYNADGTATKTNWHIEGGVIDGNAANQSALTIFAGVFIGSATGCSVVGTKVKNVYGTASAPPGETMHFEANGSSGIAFIDCEADGSGSANTASGFSTDNSHDIRWVGCTSHDMGFGMGYTCWQSSNLRYTGCLAYRNGSRGFNAERCEEVAYAACVAGGRSPAVGSDPTNPFFTSGQVNLANPIGIDIQGCKDTTLTGCVATYNGTNLRVRSNTAIAPTIPSTAVTWSGCDFRHSTTSGDTTNVVIETGTSQDVVGDSSQTFDGLVSATALNGEAPFRVYRDSGTAGIRFVVYGPTVDSGANAYRWLDSSGNVVLAVDAARRAITQGKVLGYVATATNYTATHHDEVIGVTNTSAARTITLPTLAGAVAVKNGQTYTIKDESGAAATNNITVAAGGSDTIDGAASKVISANYGFLRVYATATGWAVI